MSERDPLPSNGNTLDQFPIFSLYKSNGENVGTKEKERGGNGITLSNAPSWLKGFSWLPLTSKVYLTVVEPSGTEVHS